MKNAYTQLIPTFRVQLHQRSMRSFCANSLAPVKYKPKTEAQKSCAQNLRMKKLQVELW
jgi:hypothetical protein